MTMGNCEQMTNISFTIRCSWVTEMRNWENGENGLVFCHHVVLSENGTKVRNVKFLNQSYEGIRFEIAE